MGELIGRLIVYQSKRTRNVNFQQCEILKVLAPDLPFCSVISHYREQLDPICQLATGKKFCCTVVSEWCLPFIGNELKEQTQQRVTRNLHLPQSRPRVQGRKTDGWWAWGAWPVPPQNLPPSLNHRGNRWCLMFERGGSWEVSAALCRAVVPRGDVKFYSGITAEASQHQHPSGGEWRRRGSGSFV